MCDFHILKKNKIPYSWNTMRVGKQCNLFDNSEIADYAVEYLSQHAQESNQLSMLNWRVVTKAWR